MATQPVHAGPNNISGEGSKPSLLKKVKAKARNLKSKLKHHSNADPVSTTASGERDESSNNHDYDSPSDDSSTEENVFVIDGVPYTPVDNLLHRGSPAGAKSTNDPATLKSRAPADLQQAVPTSYNYFNEDPEAACLPSGDEVKRENSTPSEGISGGNFKDNGVAGLLHAGQPYSMETIADEEKQSQSREPVMHHVVPQDKGVGFSKQLPQSARDTPLAATNARNSANGKDSSSSGPSSSPKGSVADSPNLARDNVHGENLEVKSPPQYAVTPANSLQNSGRWSSNTDDPTSLLEQARDVVSRSSVEHSNPVEKHSDTPSATMGDQADDACMKREFGVLNHVPNELSDSPPLPAVALSSAPKNAESASASRTDVSDSAEQKPVADRLSAFTMGLKDKVIDKLSSTNQPSSRDSTPAMDVAHEVDAPNSSRSVSTADGDASNHVEMSKISEDQVPNSSDQMDAGLTSNKKLMSASRKAYFDTATAAVTPNQHDQALASSITESISKLPALLTSKLGFGGASNSRPSPTDAGPNSNLKEETESDVPVSTTPSTSEVHSTTNGAPETDHLNPAPRLLDRMSGIASSMFGGAKKSDSADGEETSSSSLPQ